MSNAQCYEISAKDVDEDMVRTMCGSSLMGFGQTLVILKDLPNRKEYRNFLISLISGLEISVTVVLWDTEQHVKDIRNPAKVWVEFINTLKGLEVKMIDKGSDFGTQWKDRTEVIKFVKGEFKRYDRTISDVNAELFGEIVGLGRGMLITEIERLSIAGPKNISEQFILDNAFQSSSAAVLYKLGDLIDKNQIEETMNKIHDFLQIGIYHELIGEVLLRRARTILASGYFWAKGHNDSQNCDMLMNMGKFPSAVWHSSGSSGEKNQKASKCSSQKGIEWYFSKYLGMPEKYFGDISPKAKKSKDGFLYTESLPHRIVAQKAVEFVHRVEQAYRGKTPDIQASVIGRLIDVYLSVSDSLKEMRYDATKSESELRKMVLTLSGLSV